AILRKEFVPHIFRVGHHHLHKFGALIILGLFLGCHLSLLPAGKHLRKIGEVAPASSAAEKLNKKIDYETDNAATCNQSATSNSSAVFNVRACAPAFPTHILAFTKVKEVAR